MRTGARYSLPVTKELIELVRDLSAEPDQVAHRSLGGPVPNDAPDLNSAFGWAWVLRSLAAQGAVRDLIWLR